MSGLVGAGVAGADPFTSSAAFQAERLKKPLSRRIIFAIEGRQCVLDSFSGCFAAERLKKPLSRRIIPAFEG